MSLRDSYDFEFLVNETERIVLKEMEAQLQEENAADVCKCQDCVLDMVALALNSLKPHYRVSLIGTLYAQTFDEGEYAQEVKRVVSSSIRKIAGNPSHD